MKDYSLRQEMLGYVTTGPCSFLTPSKALKEKWRRTLEYQQTLQREDKRERRWPSVTQETTMTAGYTCHPSD